MLTWGSKIRSWAPKSAPGHEKTKDARRKTMQNPALEKSNGAIQRKLWPKTNLEGGLAPNITLHHCPEATPFHTQI